jgi:hypothetical protein
MVAEGEYRLALLTAKRHFISAIARIEGGWGPLSCGAGLHRDRHATLEKRYREFGGAPVD